jgi:hypothetical protein
MFRLIQPSPGSTPTFLKLLNCVLYEFIYYNITTTVLLMYLTLHMVNIVSISSELIPFL